MVLEKKTKNYKKFCKKTDDQDKIQGLVNMIMMQHVTMNSDIVREIEKMKIVKIYNRIVNFN